MRLTNYERDFLRRSIVADIPQIDYEGKMQKRIDEICIALLPPEIRKLWDKPALRGFLKSGSYYYCCSSFVTPGFGRSDDVSTAAIKADAPLAELHRLKDEQRATIESVREKLRVNLAQCSTAKQFRDRFPELTKYLPATVTVENLPATTGLVDSLRAVGVPLEAEAV